MFFLWSLLESWWTSFRSFCCLLSSAIWHHCLKHVEFALSTNLSPTFMYLSSQLLSNSHRSFYRIVLHWFVELIVFKISGSKNKIKKNILHFTNNWFSSHCTWYKVVLFIKINTEAFDLWLCIAVGINQAPFPHRPCFELTFYRLAQHVRESMDTIIAVTEYSQLSADSLNLIFYLLL